MPTTTPPPSATELPPVDTSRRYVRVTEWRSDGQVAFDFAIGWPELSVELMLPRAAFDEFCDRHRVVRLDGAGADAAPPPAHDADTPGDDPR